MKIIVATPKKDCPAHHALDAEFVEHETLVTEGDFSYGKLLQSLWMHGDGFILIEHDIVPWPGAVQLLEKCSEHWCAYEYPLNFLYVNALGCTKFSSELLSKTAQISRDWDTLHWGALDGTVISRLAAKGKAPHIHYPPVAHVRRYDGNAN